MIRKTREELLTIGVMLVVLIFSLYPYSDYDWGTHYRYGEQLLKGNLLRTDIFSWTMYGVKWSNHAWLYDPMVYILYTQTGFLGLSIAGAIVGVITFWFCIRRVKLAPWQKMVLGVFFIVGNWGVYWEGLRSQMVGAMFLAVLMWFLGESAEKPKYRWGIPPLFLLWANVHGTFTLGLAVLGAFGVNAIVQDFIHKKPTEIKKIIWPFILAFAVTFVNPFTYGVYEEVLRHVSNQYLRSISDWLPITVDFKDPSINIFLVYSVLLAIGFVIRRKMSDLPHFLIWVGMMYLAFDARRYVAPFMVVTLPIAAIMLKENLGFFGRFRTVNYIFAILVLAGLGYGVSSRIIKNHLWNYGFQDYCNNSSKCSEAAVQYLLKYPPAGRGFNFYDFGGYLVGRGIKYVFIDGRMHLWNESGYMPFADHERISKGDMDVFNNYNFSWAIVASFSDMDDDISQLPEDLGWKEVYGDDYMSIWERNI